MLLLVTGASGAGKSTVRARVADNLAPGVQSVELRDLVRVLPVPTIAWRQQAAELAVRRALELGASGRHLLLAGDPVAPGEIMAAPSAGAVDRVAVCLLDLSPAAQAARLGRRGDDPALLHHHQAFAAWMRAHADNPRHMLQVLTSDGWPEMRWERLTAPSDWKIEIVDTSDLSAEQAAAEVLQWARRAIVGDAPTMRPSHQRA